jgi:hypothetical protein
MSANGSTAIDLSSGSGSAAAGVAGGAGGAGSLAAATVADGATPRSTCHNAPPIAATTNSAIAAGAITARCRLANLAAR